MKTRLSLLLLSLLCMLSSAVYAQQALYVYQNTGVIDAFFTYEVDSIRYSNLDLDSVWHATSQVQEIWTRDSTYRIPLENIDSVSFITPETVYKDDVINISDKLMDYLIRCDSMTLFFQDNTPSDILPKKGDKIVTTETNDIIYGFAGEVISITFENNEYVVTCTEVALTDVFETYYSLGTSCGYVESQNPLSSKKIGPYVDNLDFPLPLYGWEFSFAKEKGFPIENGDIIVVDAETEKTIKNDFTLSITPYVYVKTFFIIAKDQYYLSYNITGDFKIKGNFSLKGEINNNGKLGFKTPSMKTPCPFIDFYIEPGLYFESQLSAGLALSFTKNCNFIIADDLATDGQEVLQPVRQFQSTPMDWDIQGALEGSAEVGAYLSLGLKFKDKNLAKLELTGKSGTKISSSAVLKKDDLPTLLSNTVVYDRFSNVELALGQTRSIELEASILECFLGDSARLNVKIDTVVNIAQWNVVPKFNDVTFEASGVSSEAKSEINGDLLFPVGYGYSVRDESNEEIDKQDADKTFFKGNTKHDYSFPAYPIGSQYKLHPTIKWLGFEMLASPSAPLKEKEWVRIKSFEVTDTIYDEKQELEYQGEHYFYKHQCEVLVKLEDTMGVEDWGYVYVDPRGDSTFISLMSFGDVYRDNRYAYYRNNAEDSVCLIGYATFRDGEQYIGEKRVFDLVYNHYCTDENHHHGVDLGLSSNILWACCNLGATKPEEYGDYYAFAETATKNSYSEANHWYYHQDPYDPYGQYAYYETPPGGIDISGTASDVVTHHWEDGWRMPTEKELQELVDSCTWTWTTKNGIIGYQVTGPNGNSIFLPAAGAKITSNNKGKEDYAGVPNKLTWYRSSRISKPGYYNKWEYSYGLRFKQDLYDLNDGCLRFPGYVIRPVMNKKTTE